MFLHRYGRVLAPRFVSRLTSVVRTYHCQKCSFSEDSNDITLFCGKCSHLLSVPKNINYFKLLGLEKEIFYLDGKSMSTTYKNLQINLHPDKYALKDEQDQELADAWSSVVNEAYQTLKSPVQRILYLLELVKTPLVEDEIQMEPEFLAHIMEMNEELEDISSSRNLVAFTIENDNKMNSFFKQFSSLFNSGSYEEARRIAAKIKYLANLREKIKEYEEKFGLIK